jgi:hypothetical protein
VLLQHGAAVIALFVTNESNYLELSFGEYAYTTGLYIEPGKVDGLTAMRFYVELLGKVTGEDFLGLFNGERVVAKREHWHLYLNTESSTWKKAENVALLASQPYKLATYPVE